MLPSFILLDTVVREGGTGPVMDFGASRGGLVLVTLGITRIVEQESLDVAIWGSADQQDWGSKALVAFPQKFYCGTYQMLLDLRPVPDIRYVRAQWQVRRWGRGDPKPMFGIYIFAEDVQPQALALGA